MLTAKWSGPVVQRLGLLCLLALVSPGCGGGGEDPGDVFEGAWFLQQISISNPCDVPELASPVAFSQTGSDMSMTTPVETLTGTVSGMSATIAGELVRPTGGGEVATYSDILLERTGDLFTGTAVVRVRSSTSGFPVLCEAVVRFKVVAEMRVIDFNLDGATGLSLNEPLVFTFTQDVEASTVDPDTLQITGLPGSIFDVIAVDARRMALIPRPPTFGDLTDAGLAWGTTYDVLLPDYLASSSIRSTSGAPLSVPFVSTFGTTFNARFVEPSRALVHEAGPSGTPPGTGDEGGCLNNAGTSLFMAPGLQTGSGADATLLCFINQGPPHVVPELCRPAHDARDIGFPDIAPGTFVLPPFRIRINEPVNPFAVEVWSASTRLGTNVQLWRVGDAAGNPIPISQVETNRPLVRQQTDLTEVFVVAFAPQPSGTYLVNVRNLSDLPGNPLVTSDRPDPAVGGYSAIDAAIAGVVPNGYRYYVRTP